MSKIKEAEARFGRYETAWCPGCGDFMVLKALKLALTELDLEPHQILLTSGIGQAAKLPQYLHCNMFNGLHGRSIPPATGAKVVNPGLKVIAVSGDGCIYGEGGNHLLAAFRRNPDITVLVCDNMIYGLTKGQASPTSFEGFRTKAQPLGAPWRPLNPIALAVSMGCSLVARGYAGEVEHLAGIIGEAISHRGLALVDILQPCVTFNRVNTYRWFKERCYHLPDDYDPTSWEAAMAVAREDMEERIALGVIYREERPTFEDHFPQLQDGPVVGPPTVAPAMEQVLSRFEI